MAKNMVYPAIAEDCWDSGIMDNDLKEKQVDENDRKK